MARVLLEGFKRFRKDTYEGASPLMPQLVQQGQSPEYFIISCIDSRSNPGTIFRTAPGTFLAHKSMGALARPYRKGTALAATLEFAVTHNKVREIIVLGHTNCGAVEALINGIEGDEISSFLSFAQTRLQEAKDRQKSCCPDHDISRAAEEQIVIDSARNLKTYPSVQQALAEDRITIRPWLFVMEEGNIYEYDETKGQFVNITKFDTSSLSEQKRAGAQS